MQDFFELFKNLINPQWILAQPGAFWILLFVVFAETGLFVGFFLPGDTLLFITGMVLSKGHIPVTGVEGGAGLIPIALLIIAAGILGNTVGYWFGRKYGPALFTKKDTFFFKKKHLLAAKKFYEEKGASTIVIARFLPIIRTFAPIVAGIVQMDARKFMIYNVLGCFAWVLSMVLSGYYLSKAFPWLGDHLELIVLVIVLLTTTPIVVAYLRGRSASQNAETEIE